MAEEHKIIFWQGLESARSGITPAAGTPIWVTDTKKLYIGDGVTAGGIEIGSSGSFHAARVATRVSLRI